MPGGGFTLPPCGCHRGNHDSPSFLNAPREVLRYLNVHVIGCMPESIADELIVIPDRQGEPELIVCAVPYLRDRDVRRAEAGESYEEKGRTLIEGIKAHYSDVCKEAERIRRELGKQVPIIAMGHLFTAGGQTVDSDGVRDLYVGSLAHVEKDISPASIIWPWAICMCPKVAGCDFMRYSGSPIPWALQKPGRKRCCVRWNLTTESPWLRKSLCPDFRSWKP